jgi:hypothetical protein
MSAFDLLGIPESSTEKQVIKAWRELSKKHHPDKLFAADGNESNDTKMKELNAAKDACIKAIIAREYTVDELEFTRFVARKIERSMERRCGLKINLGDGEIIKGHLCEFMWYHAVDAMEWVLCVALQDWDFGYGNFGRKIEHAQE